MDETLWLVLLSAAAALGLFAVLGRRRQRGKPLKPLQRRVVLAIGAHPDDIEFGCGAALRRYRESGCETHGLVLSCGEAGVNGADDADGAAARTREHEAQRGARVMKLDSLTVLNFPDTRLESRRVQLRDAVEEAMRLLAPDIVLTHNCHDLHPDHRAVHAATLEAGRRVPTVLCYENPNTPPRFQPNYFVDVSGHLDAKIAALRCHASQRDKAYFSPHLVRSIARVRGNQGRVEFAEGFEAIRVQAGGL